MWWGMDCTPTAAASMPSGLTSTTVGCDAAAGQGCSFKHHPRKQQAGCDNQVDYVAIHSNDLSPHLS
jgi:hypothetical protein